MDTKKKDASPVKEAEEALLRRIEESEMLSSKVVREWMKEAHLPYVWLAEQMQCSENTIKNWLSGDNNIPSRREMQLRNVILKRIFLERSAQETTDFSILLANEKVAERPTGTIPSNVSDILPPAYQHALCMIAAQKRQDEATIIKNVLFWWMLQELEDAHEHIPKNRMFYHPYATYPQAVENSIAKMEEMSSHIKQELDASNRIYCALDMLVTQTAAHVEVFADPKIEAYLKETNEMKKREEKRIKYLDSLRDTITGLLTTLKETSEKRAQSNQESSDSE